MKQAQIDQWTLVHTYPESEDAAEEDSESLDSYSSAISARRWATSGTGRGERREKGESNTHVVTSEGYLVYLYKGSISFKSDDAPP